MGEYYLPSSWTCPDRLSVEDYKDRVARIQQDQYNQFCADCTERDPQWASFLLSLDPKDLSNSKLCVLVCQKCAFAHYSELGNKRCYIKYIKYAHEWTRSELNTLDYSGNYRVNKVFEALLNEQRQSSDSFSKRMILLCAQEEDKRRAKFIKNKYKKCKFLDETALEGTLAKVERQMRKHSVSDSSLVIRRSSGRSRDEKSHPREHKRVSWRRSSRNEQDGKTEHDRCPPLAKMESRGKLPGRRSALKKSQSERVVTAPRRDETMTSSQDAVPRCGVPPRGILKSNSSRSVMDLNNDRRSATSQGRPMSRSLVKAKSERSLTRSSCPDLSTCLSSSIPRERKSEKRPSCPDLTIASSIGKEKSTLVDKRAEQRSRSSHSRSVSILREGKKEKRSSCPDLASDIAASLHKEKSANKDERSEGRSRSSHSRSVTQRIMTKSKSERFTRTSCLDLSAETPREKSPSRRQSSRRISRILRRKSGRGLKSHEGGPLELQPRVRRSSTVNHLASQSTKLPALPRVRRSSTEPSLSKLV